MEFFRSILATDAGAAGLVLRLSLGIMILPHGLQKAFGWFGGHGFNGTMGFFQSLNIPWIFGFAAILAESLGGLALILGLGTRVAAAGVGITMLVAALTLHLQNGFFMNWFGQQKGEGVEFFILAVGISLALVILGGGSVSLDKVLSP